MSKKPLRDTMPTTAAFIDECRAAFGADAINSSIRAGMAGIPDHFYAEEAGLTVGTPISKGGTSFTLDQIVIRPSAIPSHQHRRSR